MEDIVPSLVHASNAWTMRPVSSVQYDQMSENQ